MIASLSAQQASVLITEELHHIPEEMGVQVNRLAEYADQAGAGDGQGKFLLQMMVAPDSDLVGRTLARIDFQHRKAAGPRHAAHSGDRLPCR